MIGCSDIHTSFLWDVLLYFSCSCFWKRYWFLTLFLSSSRWISEMEWQPASGVNSHVTLLFCGNILSRVRSSLLTRPSWYFVTANFHSVSNLYSSSSWPLDLSTRRRWWSSPNSTKPIRTWWRTTNTIALCAALVPPRKIIRGTFLAGSDPLAWSTRLREPNSPKHSFNFSGEGGGPWKRSLESVLHPPRSGVHL